MGHANENTRLLGSVNDSQEYEVKQVECEVECAENKQEDVKPQGTTGTFGAVFIVVNAAMGAGMLNIPNALKSAGGILPGIGMEMVITRVFFQLVALAQLVLSQFLARLLRQSIKLC